MYFDLIRLDMNFPHLKYLMICWIEFGEVMINFLIVGTQRRNQIGDKNIIEEFICSKFEKKYINV